ncbi:MAG: PQQ-binding-like beta-propeller repeat protein [Hyphomicrobium sp.]|jgi:outer membrane protein assembly factor BamB|nr:PQQ-binding-like beta-propeller repeat protein [Hyphomicrobium sp.]
MRRSRPVPNALALAGLSAFVLAGCSTDSLPSLPSVSNLNPFKEKQAPLPGRRIPVLPANEKIPGELADASAPIVLPAVVANEEWTQPGGTPSNVVGNLALSANPRETWRADAGSGSSGQGRIIASPIVAGGRVYTLDAEGAASAFQVAGGSKIWSQSLAPTPPQTAEAGGGFSSFSTTNLFSLGGGGDGGGYGGGLAFDNGRLFGASGFGAVIAIDPATGKRLWEKNLGAPVRSSPTAAADRVFVLTTEGRVYCLSGIDGAELWSARGLPSQASLSLNASPAVEGEVVAVPFPTGEVLGLKVLDGTPVWSETLTRTRSESQFASMTDAARPAIANGVVYSIGHAGRMAATNAKTGERLWSLNAPGTQTPWVAGDSVFIVDTRAQIMAISKRDGKIQWTTKLPTSGAWSGPVMAGNQLWAVSSKGLLVAVDPVGGRVAGQQEVGAGSYIAPVVAGGRMFLLTDTAKLIALQ